VIATEAALWGVLQGTAAQYLDTCYTRVETGLTHGGVSDVEYVHRPWHGWIELKVARWPRPGHAFRLQHPFSMAQLTWLSTHHRPATYLRSWLLVGFAGTRRWTAFLLLPPVAAACLVDGGKAHPHEYVLTRPGAILQSAIGDAVSAIGQC
jgi:hypothetical protein